MEEIKIDAGEGLKKPFDWDFYFNQKPRPDTNEGLHQRVTNLEIEVKALREIVQDQIELMKKLIDNKVPLYSGSRWIDKDLTNEGLGKDMPSMVGDKKAIKPEWTKGNSWGDWAERFKKNKDE
jgi:hypothetical protein